MATIQLYQFLVTTVDDRVIQAGSLSQARCLAIADNEATDQTYSIAAGGIVKVWDSAENEAMGGFDLLWMESDMDVLVQYTADQGVSDVYVTQELKGSGVAGTMGVARVFNSNRMDKLTGTIDSLNGTADTIDEVWVRNPSSTNVARVRVIVAT